MKKGALLAAAMSAALVLVACGGDDRNAASRQAVAAPAAADRPATGDPTVVGREELRRDMRALWEDHVTWTRLFIVSAVDGLGDVDATAARLLRNQTEIGDAIKPFLGDEAGTKLTELLNDHILTAGDLIAAAKKGDDKAVAKTSKAWYRNGNQIADFLAGAGVGSRSDLRAMMKGHLDTTLDEAVARLSGDYEAEIAAYDEVRRHIHHMSDALADGIFALQGPADGPSDY
jgi:hypothetical protein